MEVVDRGKKRRKVLVILEKWDSETESLSSWMQAMLVWVRFRSIARLSGLESLALGRTPFMLNDITRRMDLFAGGERK